MTARSEHTDEQAENQVVAESADNTLELVGKNDRHNWLQRGVEMVCDGANDHFPHGYLVAPELVYVGETDIGLQFKNVKTGEQIVEKFR